MLDEYLTEGSLRHRRYQSLVPPPCRTRRSTWRRLMILDRDFGLPMVVPALTARGESLAAFGVMHPRRQGATIWSFYILSPGIARAEALALLGTSGARGLK